MLETLLSEQERNSLTPAEKTLLSLVQMGHPIFLQSGNEQNDKLENADKWGIDRTIRANLLSWLCTYQAAAQYIRTIGITITGAKIQGALNFIGATLSFPLGLIECAIPDGIYLLNARTRTIGFTGSRTSFFHADGLRTEGTVFMNNGFRAEGEVRLNGAQIDGGLDCSHAYFVNKMYLMETRINGRLLFSGATFEHKNGYALTGDGLHIDGSVLLNENFRNDGELSLAGAHIQSDLDCSRGNFKNEVYLPEIHIGGRLSCSNASFENRKGRALTVDGLCVEGSVFLDEVHAEGEVRLTGARIGGPLICTGAKFKNTDGIALGLDGLHTEGSVFLQDGFYAEGEVRLLGAHIGGQLVCSGGTFKNPNGIAFSAQHMEVEASLIWDALASKPEGDVILAYAHVGQLADDEASWPQPSKLRLNGFEYGVFTSDSPQSAESRLRWLSLQPQGNGRFWPQPYEQLAKVFRNNGHEPDAIKVLIAKQDDLRKFGKLSRKANAWNWFIGKTIAHGYKPWKAFWPILFFVIVGTGIFSWADSEGVMQPSKERIYLDSKFIETQQLPDRYPRFQPIMYSVDTFFPFVDLHQEDYWLPSTSFPATKYILGEPWGAYFRIYMWFHIISGWILSAFAVAALTGLTRKD